MRWFPILFSVALVSTGGMVGCSWNKKKAHVSDASGPAMSQAPLNDSKYQKLVEQFESDGDDFEKQVRGLEEESWTDMFKKAGGSIKNALTIKPRVDAASDPVSLASGIPELGPDVYYQAGVLAEERHQLEQALRQYARALEKDPNYLPAQVATARLMDSMGQYAQAKQLYESAIRAHPDDAAPYNGYALSLARQRQWPAAEAALRKAVALEPKNARYRNNLAMVLVQAGKVDTALQELLAGFEPAAAHYNLAYMLKDNGQIPAARRHLQQALQINPRLGAAQQLLAKLNELPAEGAQHIASRVDAASAQAAEVINRTVSSAANQAAAALQPATMKYPHATPAPPSPTATQRLPNVPQQ